MFFFRCGIQVSEREKLGEEDCCKKFVVQNAEKVLLSNENFLSNPELHFKKVQEICSEISKECTENSMSDQQISIKLKEHFEKNIK